MIVDTGAYVVDFIHLLLAPASRFSHLLLGTFLHYIHFFNYVLSCLLSDMNIFIYIRRKHREKLLHHINYEGTEVRVLAVW